MGMVGLFVGPVLMALLFAIWREWVLTTEAEILDEAMRENPKPKSPSRPRRFFPSAGPSGVLRSRVRCPGRHAWPKPISGIPTRSSRAGVPRFKHLSRKSGLPLIWRRAVRIW